MDRRSFLRRLGIGTATAVVAPHATVEALTPAPPTRPVEANEFIMVAERFDGLVASGGMCAPSSFTYDFFVLAEPSRPVEEALPAVRAPRGGIRFISQ